MKITRAQLARLRKRHFGYRLTLGVELAVLLLLPLAQSVTWLLSVLWVVLAIEMLVFLSRYSALGRRSLMYGLGGLAVVLEIIWHLALVWTPALGKALTLPHVMVWVAFLLVTAIRKVKSLVREPFVTFSVVLGAASGYLSIGLAGGVLLTALWVLQPSAYVAAALPPVSPMGDITVAVAPALMAAAFSLLTTVGTDVMNSANVTAQVVSNLITISGQLYVAILIGLILGRFHQRVN
ncbi:MAG: hypothetical protein FJ053_00750 [Cyanobacteria bacterium M_surface_10_m1_298]|nr:hypothetical protein [Cyanobacteria bacterium M_surface_10_m1_298]